jgi:hypothetical protein
MQSAPMESISAISIICCPTIPRPFYLDPTFSEEKDNNHSDNNDLPDDNGCIGK